MLLLLLFACEKAVPGERSTVDMVEFDGLWTDAAWTWRDDKKQDDPDEERLIRGRMEEDGTLRLRRGARWADAADIASLRFDNSDGLSLIAWDFGPSVGEGDKPLTAATVHPSSRTEAGGWSCVADVGVTDETFYATFTDTVQVDCTGPGLPGVWTFARDLGLVHFLGRDGLEMDLVAPY